MRCLGKRAGGEKAMFDAPCEAVRGARDDGSELLIESRGNVAVIGEVGVLKGDGLVRYCGGLLPREVSEETPVV